jgi:hypothetical protein
VAVAALPFGVTEAGLMLHVAFEGAPEQERLTAELNPPAGVMVTVELTLLPLATLPEPGERLSVKLGAGAAVTVMTSADEVLPVKLASPL